MGTMGLAERIRRAIEAKPMMTNSIPIAVTASFGVTASVAKSRLDAQEILRLADAALYRVKERGRNRAVLARPEDWVVTATDLPDTVGQNTTTRSGAPWSIRSGNLQLRNWLVATVFRVARGVPPVARFASLFRNDVRAMCARRVARKYGAVESVRRDFKD
jgi:hypothetical protein